MMTDINIEPRTLEYIQKELNDPQIAYNTPPQPITGGVETEIYTFQLKNVSNQISEKLVLRIYPDNIPYHRAQVEGLVQNYLAENGYPAPSVPFICTDPSILGRTFIIMEYIPGTTLGQYNEKVGETLAEITYELQLIDPEPLCQNLLSTGIEEQYLSGVGWREDYILSNNLDWIKPALDWIKENRPEPEYVICHGDLHANNVLMENGKVSGVLDWAALIDDICRDLGSTTMLYSLMAPCIMPERADEFISRSKRFLDLYSQKRFIDPWKLEYYQALRCLWVMVSYEMGFPVVRDSGMIHRVIERFKEITGAEIKVEKL
jgi:aminoglycoside phosphotransferase (APT) family kinase protein